MTRHFKIFSTLSMIVGMTIIAMSSLAAQTYDDQPDCVTDTLPWLGCFFYTSDVSLRHAKPDFLSLEEFIALNPRLSDSDEETLIPAFQVLRYLEGNDATAHNLVIHDGPREYWHILDIPVEIILGSAHCAVGGDVVCASGSGVPKHIRQYVRHPYSPEKVAEIDRLNELLEINENTIIPPFTMIRTR